MARGQSLIGAAMGKEKRRARIGFAPIERYYRSGALSFENQVRGSESSEFGWTVGLAHDQHGSDPVELEINRQDLIGIWIGKRHEFEAAGMMNRA